jgi:hypothetical protein
MGDLMCMDFSPDQVGAFAAFVRSRGKLQSEGPAVDLLVKIGVGFPLRRGARTVLEEWRNGLATPEQMLRVVTNDELEIGGDAVMSEADDGYRIAPGSGLGEG